MDNIINSAAQIRHNNKKKILNYLMMHDCVTKKEIAMQTDLSPATVSNLSNQLIEDVFILVSSYQKSSGGRNAGLLTIKNNRKYYLALRIIDEFQVEAALISFEKEIVKSFFVSVKDNSMSGMMEACEAGISRCLEGEPDFQGEILGVGVALPGIVDMDKGILLNSTIAFLEDKPVVTELQHRIKYPVTGANESNILALALATQENRDTLLQDTIYLHVDEGLGIGIICNGSLLTGSHNQGGEISHMPIGSKGLLCKCGKRGCVETELSLNGFLNDFEEIANRNVSWKDFCLEAENKNVHAMQVLEEKGRVLGRLFSILDALFDPSVFYLGGRGVDLFDEMAAYIENEYRSRLFIDKSKSLRLYPCYDYDKLLLKGCADLAFDYFALQD